MFCPLCHRSYTDPRLAFCSEDGTLLIDTPPVQPSAPRRSGTAGTVFGGRYAIQGLIGKGGLSRVYLAEDIKTGQAVALKLLESEFAKNRTVRERFLREVDIAVRLGHPNIAQILDSGEGPGQAPFIVIELLTGEPLGSLLKRVRRVSEDFALQIVKRAASALWAAHGAGVIHRDIKPDNLFLVNDGSILKVLDFGMAKLQEGAFTAAGVAIGTVPYMAPEQATTDPVDGRTDVYGLGITLYRGG